MHEVTLVAPQALPFVWEKVSEFLKLHGEAWLRVVELEDICKKLCLGELELWLGDNESEFELVMICGWEKHAKQNFYHIMWVGGRNLKAYMPFGLEVVEQYACLAGATEVVFEGREGWAKLLEPKGYASSRMLRKNVQVCWRN